MMSRHLPFSGLTAFRAIAAHKTFAEAGAALNVSQPAISRRLRELEIYLGCALFNRTTKPLSLTIEGRELLEAIERGFGVIETATERLQHKTTAPSITVTGPTGFLNYWFLHKLETFNQAFPDTSIKVIDSDASGAGRVGDIDIRFLNSDTVDTLSDSGSPIFNEAVFAAASPAYLAQANLVDLRVSTRNHVFLSVDAGDKWYSWGAFFKKMGTLDSAPRRQFEFNSYSLLVNSMLSGHGIGLAWDGLLDKYFHTGALVRLSDVHVATKRGYYLFLRDGAGASRHVREVADWILSRPGTSPDTISPLLDDPAAEQGFTHPPASILPVGA
jgi:DNA-binding transcriptional LysR family regulator